MRKHWTNTLSLKAIHYEITRLPANMSPIQIMNNFEKNTWDILNYEGRGKGACGHGSIYRKLCSEAQIINNISIRPAYPRVIMTNLILVSPQNVVTSLVAPPLQPVNTSGVQDLNALFKDLKAFTEIVDELKVRINLLLTANFS